MTITTRRVTGPVVLADGTVPSHGRMTFTLSDWDVEGDTTIASGQRVADLTVDGEIDVLLWASDQGARTLTYQADLTYYNPGARAQLTVRFPNVYVTAGAGDLAWADLLQIPAPDPTVPDALAQLLGAVAGVAGSAAAADASATEAAGSASAASASQSAAAGSEAAALAAKIAAQAAADNAQSSALTVATWSALSALTASADGTGAEVLDTDTGTHLAASATGYDGASVSNAGRYSWLAAWSRWVRIGGTGLSNKTGSDVVSDAYAGSEENGISISDPAGNPALISTDQRLKTPVIEITTDRIVHATIDELDARQSASDGYPGTSALEIVDDDGAPVLASDRQSFRTGAFFAGVEDEKYDGDARNGLVIDDLSGNPALTATGDLFEVPVLRATQTTITHPAIQALEEAIDLGLSSTNPLLRYAGLIAPAQIVHIIVHGQSLSTDTGNAPDEISNTPASFALMFNGGPDWNIAGTTAEALLAANTPATIAAAHASLVPLQEGNTATSSGETPSYGVAQMMQELALAHGHGFGDAYGQRLLMSNPGIGGSSIAELSSTPWRDYVDDDINYARSLCNAAGKTVALGALPVIQGESDSGTDPEVWKQGWRDLKASILAKAQATYGTPQLLISPIYQKADAGAITEAQLELAAEDGWCLATPIYWLEKVSDGTHLTARSAKWMGAYFGRAIYEWLWLGQRPEPMVPFSVVRIGTALALQFPVKAGNKLVFDTTQVPQADNYGFQLFSGATEITITGVSITGRDTVTLQTAAPVPGNVTLKYGYNGDGTTQTENLRSNSFGNLRDNDPLVFDASDLALPMYKWAPSFTQEIA